MQKDQEFEDSWATWNCLKKFCKPNKIVVFPSASVAIPHLLPPFCEQINRLLFTVRLSPWFVLVTSFYFSLYFTTSMTQGCFSLLLKLFSRSLNCYVCLFVCLNTSTNRDSPDLWLWSWTRVLNKARWMQTVLCGQLQCPFLQAIWKVAYSPSFSKWRDFCPTSSFYSFKFPFRGIVSIS
jgi:hypothetical protein